MNEHYYALIMAGGGGTRLWPLSRRTRPKQMLPLVSDDSLFRVSVTRLAPIFPPERIFVVTGAHQVDALKADVPELPAENFIVEPYGRDSAPAAALGMTHIAGLDSEATVAILTADHYIRDVWSFGAALKTAYEVAQDHYIVTLGIKPTAPATGFGYIQQAEFLAKYDKFSVYHSAGFKEKPDAKTAQQFLDAGTYSWNSGMFIWSVQQAQEEFARQQPEMAKHLQSIKMAFGKRDYHKVIQSVWDDLPKISLDYAVMENAQQVAMIPIDIGWSDIGSWAALYEELASTAGQNISMGSGEVIPIDSTGNLTNSNRLIVTIGAENLVIIDTDDVLMICRRDMAQKVKQAVNHMKENNLERYL